MLERSHAYFNGLLTFVTHIDLTCGIFTNQNHSKAGRKTML